MKAYTQYNSETGEILKSGICQDDIFDTMCNVIDCIYNDSEYYIVNGAAVPRPIFIDSDIIIKADGIETVVVDNLPSVFVVKIDSDTYEINDGVFEFNTAISGMYSITPLTFPYVEKTIIVTAL